MKNALIATMAIIIVLLATLVGVLLQEPNISVFEIDRDRVAVASKIALAKDESAKYSGGFVKDFIQLRLAILSVTDDMLEQKRASIIRRISMTYPVGSKPVSVATDAELDEILQELKQAEDHAAQSRKEAAKYSGGLVQSLALMKAETDEMGVAQLRLKFYSAKHGFPILPTLPKDGGQKNAVPLGKVVGDKEAL
jgi:hypothetical protein